MDLGQLRVGERFSFKGETYMVTSIKDGYVRSVNVETKRPMYADHSLNIDRVKGGDNNG